MARIDLPTLTRRTDGLPALSKYGTMKGKEPKTHPWTELAKESLFTIAQLRILHEHYATLHRFCVDPKSAQQDVKHSGQVTTTGTGDTTSNESSLDMTFGQYVASLRSLTTHGSSTQQFEYLFSTYAVENERGISRNELFQLLQDHYKLSAATETRHFERLYTWLKKHFPVYDKTRSGFLSLHATLEMLHTHADALYHIQLQVDPFLQKLGDNNAQYQTKAKAAAIPL